MPCTNRCRTAAAYAFSTAGLVVMTALYSTAGGFLFQWLETDRERTEILKSRRLVDAVRTEHVQLLWNLTEALNVLYRSNWTQEAEAVLQSFQDGVYRIAVQAKWDGKASGEDVVPKWSLPGSLLYAVTAITTIGYGHVTPLTTEGRVATMLYALLGIPLTIMCMANLGKFFAKVFRLVYHALCCGLCCFCCTYRRRSGNFRPQPPAPPKHDAPGALPRNGTSNDKRANENSRRDGNGVVAVAVSGDEDCRSAASHPARLDVCEEKVKRALVEEAAVPIYLCLVVMTAYICAGAAIFGLWEGWGYVAGAYFCFVTLTTIGFGDFIPGLTVSSESDEWVSGQKLVICVVYVFFGLALVAMCFDLMREAVTAKVLWLARKMGLIKETDL